MNKKRCFAPVCLLLFVALILTGCGGETFDKTNAQEKALIPEYRLTAVFTDRNGKELREKNVLKEAEGVLHFRLSLSYESTLPRRVGFLLFLDGIPQRFSVNGENEDTFHAAKLPEESEFAFVCRPVGAESGTVNLSFVVLGNIDGMRLNLSDATELDATVFRCLAQISSDTGKADLAAPAAPLSLEDKISSCAPDPDKELTEKEKEEREKNPDYYAEEPYRGYCAHLTSCVYTSVKGKQKDKLLVQYPLLSYDYTAKDEAQYVFEGIGVPGKTYRTTVFVDRRPCGAFGGKDTLEWSAERGNYYREDLTFSFPRTYAERRLFAVTVDEDGNCTFTPDLCFLYSTAQNEQAVFGYGSSGGVGEGGSYLSHSNKRLYTGGDLTFILNYQVNSLLRTGTVLTFTLNGTPIESVFRGERKTEHTITIESNQKLRETITIPEEQLPEGDFSVCIYLLPLYNPMNTNPFFGSRPVLYNSYLIRYYRGKLPEGDFPTDRTERLGGFFTETTQQEPSIELTMIVRDKAILYFRPTGQDGTAKQVKLYWNGSELPLSEEVRAAIENAKPGENVMIPLEIPKDRLLSVNSVFLTAEICRDGIPSDILVEAATVQAVGTVNGASPVTVWRQEKSTLLESADSVLGSCVLYSVGRDNYYINNLVSATERVVLPEGIGKSHVFSHYSENLFCRTVTKSKTGIEITFYRFPIAYSINE